MNQNLMGKFGLYVYRISVLVLFFIFLSYYAPRIITDLSRKSELSALIFVILIIVVFVGYSFENMDFEDVEKGGENA